MASPLSAATASKLSAIAALGILLTAGGCGRGGSRPLPPERPVVYKLAVSPDGKTLAAVIDKDIRMWELPSWKPLPTLAQGAKPLSALAFTPDGTRLASVTPQATIQIWDWANGHVEGNLTDHKIPPLALACTNNGKYLVSGSANPNPFAKVAELRVWELKTNKLAAELKVSEPVTCLAVSPNDKTLVTGHNDGSVMVWDLEKKEAKQTLKDHGDTMKAIAFTPDGSLAATGSIDGTVYLWDTESWQKKATLKGDDDNLNSLAISPKGALLASGGEDRTVHIFDLKTNAEKRRLQGHANAINSIVFAADGTVISGGTDSTIRVWDPQQGKELRKITSD